MLINWPFPLQQILFKFCKLSSQKQSLYLLPPAAFMLFLEVVAWICFVMKVFLKSLPEAWNFVKKRLWHRCFLLYFANFKNTFPIENLWWLLLYVIVTHHTQDSFSSIGKFLKIHSSATRKGFFRTCYNI